MADLKAAGTTPETREELIALVMEGLTQSIILHRRGTGMGSAGDELRLLAFTNLIISAFDTVWKYDSFGGDWFSKGAEQLGWMMLLRIFSIFSTKYEENSWHASGVLGAERPFPLFSRKFTVLKVFLESPQLLLNFFQKKGYRNVISWRWTKFAGLY